MNQILIKPVLLFFVFCLGLENGLSQHLNLKLEFFSQQNINAQINKSEESIHSGFRPLIQSELENHSIYDSIGYAETKDKLFSDKFKSKWIYRKVRAEDFIIHQSKNFNLKINPLFDFTYKKSPDYNQTFYNNTRGIEFKGDIGKKFSFYTAFYENEARFAPYIASYVNEHRIAPGQGAVKILKNNKFDFSQASAYFTIKASKNITIQAGHYKHFVGEGYRSLLLSDNSFNYPYLRFSATFGKLQYTLIWNQYQLFEGAYYNYHQRKYGSVSYLSWAPKPGFEFGLFESVMWPGNTPEEKNNFNLNFFNPVILSRVSIYGLNAKENILVGINSRIKIYKFAQFFGQFALDNLDADVAANNNYAFQLGFKHFDLFHQQLKNQKLFLHTEYNYISPYTYAYKDVQQSYSHYNQPITYPAGSGLKELLAAAKYSFKDVSLEVRASYLINSIDTISTNFGSNIFLPNEVQNGIVSHTGNTPGQGIKNELIHLYSELSFTINPATNMRFFMALHIRENSNQLNSERKTFYSFGIKTNINNYYYDF
jgi:hypothetical protein